MHQTVNSLSRIEYPWTSVHAPPPGTRRQPRRCARWQGTSARKVRPGSSEERFVGRIDKHTHRIGHSDDAFPWVRDHTTNGVKYANSHSTRKLFYGTRNFISWPSECLPDLGQEYLLDPEKDLMFEVGRGEDRERQDKRCRRAEKKNKKEKYEKTGNSRRGKRDTTGFFFEKIYFLFFLRRHVEGR